MAEDIVNGVALGVPCHVEEQRDGIFHGLEVSDIENPEALYAIVSGESQLLPHVLYRGHINPFRVAGRADIVYMVVQSPASLVLALLGCRHTADIAPVVVAQQHDDIVRHTHALVIIVEHLLVQRPYLWCLLCRAACDILYYLPLVSDNLHEELCVCLRAHRLVAIAAHTDGDNVVSAFHALYSLTEETLYCLTVGIVVPCAVFLAVACPLLVVAGHGLVV